MASMNNEENKGKGAAEEPEPEPDDASSTPGAASYDPTIYQRPHPDDRGGGGGGGACGGGGGGGGGGQPAFGASCAKDAAQRQRGHADPSSPPRPGGRAAKEQAVAEEWGFTDSKMAATLLKRQERLRKLQRDSERRKGK